MIPIDQQIQRISRRAERIISEEELRKKLSSGKQMRIKFGMDPTAPDVTLGHAVPLKIIRAFQEFGHKAVLIIGDYTARVGDPSGRNTTRPVLSGEQIDANAQTYLAQVNKILLNDPEHLEVRFNSEWLGKMTILDVIRLLGRKTIAQVLQRDDFAKRYSENVDIRLHELFYPLLQGWDSVMVKSDVEMGGSDQLFNNLVGRDFQKEEGQESQIVIVTPLLVGTDGVKKMSKSVGNYIGVTDPPSGPNGMFGKVMRIPDSLLEMYYTLLTDMEPADFKSQISNSPRDAKIRLAKTVITWLHSAQDADAAEEEFKKVIVGGGIPDEMPEVKIGPGPHKLPPLLVQAGLAASNGEATRKMKEGAVKIDGEKQIDNQKQYTFDKPVVLQLGNRKFARLIP